MKYTKENLIGIGIKSNNRDESYKIIDKLATLGITKGWTGNSGLCYYGLDNKGFSICCDNTLHEFKSTISFEEFMNDNEDEIINNFEIY